MKYMFKRLAAIPLCAAVAFSVSGCEQKPEKRLAKAKKNLTKVESMVSTLEVDGEMVIAGDTVHINSTYDSTYIKEPQRAKIDILTDMGQYGSRQTEVIAEATDKSTYRMYYKGSSDLNIFDPKAEESKNADAQTEPNAEQAEQTEDNAPKEWTTAPMTVETFNQYSGIGGVGLFIDSGNDFTEVAVETVNGLECARFRGFIKEADIQSTLARFGALQTLLAAIPTDESGSPMDVFAGVGNIPVSIWVDNVDNYPVKYEIDFTDVAKKLVGNISMANRVANGTVADMQINEPNAKSKEPVINRLFMSMTNGSFNNAQYFEIPTEALTTANQSDFDSAQGTEGEEGDEEGAEGETE